MSCKYTGQKTADGVLVIQPGNLMGIILTPDATNSATIDLYDAITKTGSIVASLTAGAGTKDTVSIMFPTPIHFNTGLWGEVTCSGTCTFEVYYE